MSGAIAVGIEASACDICGTADPLGLGVCAACAGGGGDSLLFLDRSVRRADREALAAWITQSLGGVIDRDAARDVADGVRPIVGLPGELAGRVAASLSLQGLAASGVPAERAWKKTPPAFLGLLGSILGAGLFAGVAVAPWVFGLSAVFAGLLAIACLRRLAAPVWVPDAASVLGLPDSTEARVRATLTRLSTERARRYLADLASLSGGLLNPGDGEPEPEVREAVDELLGLACEAAIDLDNLDAGLAVLERRAEGGPIDVVMAEAVADAGATGTLLARRFDESLAALARLQAVTVDAPKRLVELAEKLAEDADHRARAWENVRRLTD